VLPENHALRVPGQGRNEPWRAGPNQGNTSTVTSTSRVFKPGRRRTRGLADDAASTLGGAEQVGRRARLSAVGESGEVVPVVVEVEVAVPRSRPAGW
jgi:hypothetical protein